MVSQPKIDVLLDAKAVIGEGPVYDEANNELVWVDINAKKIHFLNLSNQSNRSLTFSDTVGAAVPCRSKKNLVAVIGKKIQLVDRLSGECKELASVEEDKPKNRFNDAKCDKKGRLWCGTMPIEETKGVFAAKQGNLHSYDGVSVKRHVSDITISNGMDWSPDWTKMYYIDSIPRQVYSFDYNEATGEITNQKTIVDLNNDPTHGLPDGMCIDTQGKIWVAEYTGGCVCRWDPETGELLTCINLPAPKITSCCFGGPSYDILYVTSASVFDTEDDKKKYPFSGAIFAISNLGVSGFPAQFFDDSKCV